MDGTLIDSEPAWVFAQRRLVEQHSGIWTDEDWTALIGSDMPTTAAAISAKGVPGSAAEITRALTEQVAEALRTAIQWRPGAVALVQALKDAGVPQAIVTTSPMNIVQVVAAALPEDAMSVSSPRKACSGASLTQSRTSSQRGASEPTYRKVSQSKTRRTDCRQQCKVAQRCWLFRATFLSR